MNYGPVDRRTGLSNVTNAFKEAASHTVLKMFAQSMMGTVEPAYPATLPKA